MDPKPQLIWTYQLEDQRQPIGEPVDWVEVFETTYEGRPVDVGIRIGTHPVFQQKYDTLFLRIYSGSDKKYFVGLIARVGQPGTTEFTKSLGDKGQGAMNPEERPTLEAFVNEYKPIFESQRELRETFQHLL